MWFVLSDNNLIHPVFIPKSRPVNYDGREIEDVEYEDLSNELDNEPCYV